MFYFYFGKQKQPYMRDNYCGCIYCILLLLHMYVYKYIIIILHYFNDINLSLICATRDDDEHSTHSITIQHYTQGIL